MGRRWFFILKQIPSGGEACRIYHRLHAATAGLATASGLATAGRLTATASAVTVEQTTELAEDAALGTAARITAVHLASARRLCTAAGLAAAHFAATATTVAELTKQTAQAATTTWCTAVHFAAARRLNTAARLTATRRFTTARLTTTTTEQPEAGVGVLGAGEHEGGAKEQRRQNGTTLHFKRSSKNMGERETQNLSLRGACSGG